MNKKEVKLKTDFWIYTAVFMVPFTLNLVYFSVKLCQNILSEFRGFEVIYTV